MALRFFPLMSTLMGICITNGAWLGVDTDGVVVVGKMVLLLGVFTDRNNVMLIGTCRL